MAYLSAINSERFRHRLHAIPQPVGPDRVEYQVLVTAKGYAYLAKFLADAPADERDRLVTA